MLGRCAASQTASASAASFFCRLTNGLTYAGGIRRAVYDTILLVVEDAWDDALRQQAVAAEGGEGVRRREARE